MSIFWAPIAGFDPHDDLAALKVALPVLTSALDAAASRLTCIARLLHALACQSPDFLPPDATAAPTQPQPSQAQGREEEGAVPSANEVRQGAG